MNDAMHCRRASVMTLSMRHVSLPISETWSQTEEKSQKQFNTQRPSDVPHDLQVTPLEYQHDA